MDHRTRCVGRDSLIENAGIHREIPVEDNDLAVWLGHQSQHMRMSAGSWSHAGYCAPRLARNHYKA